MVSITYLEVLYLEIRELSIRVINLDTCWDNLGCMIECLGLNLSNLHIIFTQDISRMNVNFEMFLSETFHK